MVHRPAPHASMLQLHPVTLPCLRRSLSPLRSLSTTTTTIKAATMSTTTTTTTAIEHVVLFSIKPDAPPALVDSMVSSLRALSSLPSVSHLHCGPVLRHRSTAASPFSYLLHARYPSRPDLDAYSSHPAHLSAVREHVHPIYQDILAFDWVSPPLDPRRVPLPPGSAARLTLARLADGDAGKAEVLQVLGGVDSDAGVLGASQVSFGENFAPARAKGYSLAMMVVFDGEEGLEALEKPNEAVEARKEEVRKFLESVIVLDFVVPTPSPSDSHASL